MNAIPMFYFPRIIVEQFSFILIFEDVIKCLALTSIYIVNLLVTGIPAKNNIK